LSVSGNRNAGRRRKLRHGSRMGQRWWSGGLIEVGSGTTAHTDLRDQLSRVGHFLRRHVRLRETRHTRGRTGWSGYLRKIWPTLAGSSVSRVRHSVSRAVLQWVHGQSRASSDRCFSILAIYISSRDVRGPVFFFWESLGVPSQNAPIASRIEGCHPVLSGAGAVRISRWTTRCPPPTWAGSPSRPGRPARGDTRPDQGRRGATCRKSPRQGRGWKSR